MDMQTPSVPITCQDDTDFLTLQEAIEKANNYNPEHPVEWKVTAGPPGLIENYNWIRYVTLTCKTPTQFSFIRDLWDKISQERRKLEKNLKVNASIPETHPDWEEAPAEAEPQRFKSVHERHMPARQSVPPIYSIGVLDQTKLDELREAGYPTDVLDALEGFLQDPSAMFDGDGPEFPESPDWGR